LRTRWRRASRTGEGQQSPQNELEHCRRKFPLLWRAGSSPAGEGALEVACTLCRLPWRGNCTSGQFSSSRTLYRRTVKRMVKRAKSLGDVANDLDRGAMPHEPSVGDADRLLSQARLASYNFRGMLTHALTLSGAQCFPDRAQIGETHLRILAG
jgi:hypothetical protein